MPIVAILFISALVLCRPVGNVIGYSGKGQDPADGVQKGHSSTHGLLLLYT